MLTFTKSGGKKIAAVLFVFSLSLSLFAQAALSSQSSQSLQHPDIEPLFTVQIKNPAKWTADEIFETALLFSECEKDSQSWNRCLEEFKNIKKEVTSSEYMKLSEEDRGRAILKYLYRDYLKTYNFNQTKVDKALETGLYNCVSSAILYMSAARAAGLEVRGQRTTQHAFCTVYVPGSGGKSGVIKKIDVETTNPYGFNPGSKEEIENESKIKQYYVVPKKYYSNRQEVSDGIFTGLIAGNLTADYIKTGEYNKALPLGAARWEIIKKEPEKTTASVRNEFDILAGNYVNLLPDSAEAYSSTLDWFSAFVDRWGNNFFLQKNLDTSFINLLVLCSREENYTLARTAYDKYKTKISQSQIAKAEEIFTDIIIITATEGLSPEQKVAETNKLLASKELSSQTSQKRGKQHLESFWLECLNEFMISRDFEAGYENARQASSQLPSSSKIKAMQNNFYNNCIAIIHNNFARLANLGEYSAAKSVLEEALKKYPDDKTIKKDLLELQKVYN